MIPRPNTGPEPVRDPKMLDSSPKDYKFFPYELVLAQLLGFMEYICGRAGRLDFIILSEGPCYEEKTSATAGRLCMAQRRFLPVACYASRRPMRNINGWIAKSKKWHGKLWVLIKETRLAGINEPYSWMTLCGGLTLRSLCISIVISSNMFQGYATWLSAREVWR